MFLRMPLAEPLACIFIPWHFDESSVYIDRNEMFLFRNFLYIYIYKRCLLPSDIPIRCIIDILKSRKLLANIKFTVISSFNNSDLRYWLSHLLSSFNTNT